MSVVLHQNLLIDIASIKAKNVVIQDGKQNNHILQIVLIVPYTQQNQPYTNCTHADFWGPKCWIQNTQSSSKHPSDLHLSLGRWLQRIETRLSMNRLNRISNNQLIHVDTYISYKLLSKHIKTIQYLVHCTVTLHNMIFFLLCLHHCIQPCFSMRNGETLLSEILRSAPPSSNTGLRSSKVFTSCTP